MGRRWVYDPLCSMQKKAISQRLLGDIFFLRFSVLALQVLGATLLGCGVWNFCSHERGYWYYVKKKMVGERNKGSWGIYSSLESPPFTSGKLTKLIEVI